MKLILSQKDSVLRLVASFLKPHLNSLEIESSNDLENSCLFIEHNDKTTEVRSRKVICETLSRLPMQETKNMYYCSVDDPEVKIAKFDQLLTLALDSKPEDLLKILPSNISSPYIMGKQLTIIDIACYSSLRGIINSIGEEVAARNKALISWFVTLQKNIEPMLKALDLAPLQLNYDSLKSNKGSKGKKTEKTPVPLVISPKLIDLRVGLIKDCQKHEQADSLYVEQIDVGEEAPRTIVSGLVNHISLNEMQNRYVVVVCNLKPVSMRGVKSYGMVLAATSAEGKVELVEPPENSKPGDAVYIEGYQNIEKSFEILNPKKKIWESVQPGLKTDEELQATYHDEKDGGRIKLIVTNNGKCTVRSVKNANIK